MISESGRMRVDWSLRTGKTWFDMHRMCQELSNSGGNRLYVVYDATKRQRTWRALRSVAQFYWHHIDHRPYTIEIGHKGGEVRIATLFEISK